MSFFKQFKKKERVTSEEQRQKSIDTLKNKGIQTFEELPLIEDFNNTKIRSKQEVVKRALALMLVALYAEKLSNPEHTVEESKDFINRVIDIYGAHDFFSPFEKAFLDAEEPAHGMIVNHSWQYEPFSVMLWALGFLDTKEALDIPATISDVSKTVKIVHQYKSYEEFYKAANLVSKELIIEQADLIYRYNWKSVDERINGVEGNELVWSITMERHKSLNWLVNYSEADWDDVSTDT